MFIIILGDPATGYRFLGPYTLDESQCMAKKVAEKLKMGGTITKLMSFEELTCGDPWHKNHGMLVACPRCGAAR